MAVGRSMPPERSRAHSRSSADAQHRGTAALRRGRSRSFATNAAPMSDRSIASPAACVHSQRALVGAGSDRDAVRDVARSEVRTTVSAPSVSGAPTNRAIWRGAAISATPSAMLNQPSQSQLIRAAGCRFVLSGVHRVLLFGSGLRLRRARPKVGVCASEGDRWPSLPGRAHGGVSIHPGLQQVSRRAAAKRRVQRAPAE